MAGMTDTSLYKEHLAVRETKASEALEEAGFAALVLSSGAPALQTARRSPVRTTVTRESLKPSAVA